MTQFMGIYEYACVWVHTHIHIHSKADGQIEK